MNVTVSAGTFEPRQPDLSAAPPGALQLFGVALAPMAWALQLVVNYAIAAYPCFEHGAARLLAMADWGPWRVSVLVVNLVAIAATFASIGIGGHAIRWSRAQSISEERHSRVVARTYALGVAAVLFGVMFLLATIFALIAILGTPLCPV